MIMGQYSWLDCNTNEVILDNLPRKVYLLVPEEFGGGHLMTDCYDGYGHIGVDVYAEVARWNRKWLSEHPEFKLYDKRGMEIGSVGWYKDYANLNLSESEVVSRQSELFEWRYIGIAISCYDEDNVRLKYPLKITYDPEAVYEKSNWSLGDPGQGWSEISNTKMLEYLAYKRSMEKAVIKTGPWEVPKPRKRYPG